MGHVMDVLNCSATVMKKIGLDISLFLIVISAISSSSGHPCHSSVGQASDICKHLLKHCDTDQGDGSPICKSLRKEDDQKNDNRLDLGVKDLNSAKTSNLASSLHPDEILWTLYSIPTDLLGFYTNFARGVRRGFNDIVSKVSSGGSRLYQDITGIVPSSGYSQKKVGTDDNSDEETDVKTKKTKDDPSSPYSVNYAGQLGSKPNSGYSLTLQEKNGAKSGSYKYSSPQHSVSLAWPREDTGDDWSTKQIADTEDTKDKDIFKPDDKDDMKYSSYNNVDYDGYGNIYLLSEEDTDHYDYAPDINVVKDNFGYKSTFIPKPNPFEKDKTLSKYTNSNLMVNLIKGTENMQKPWVERPPQQRYRPTTQTSYWESNPNRRRKTEMMKNINMGNGSPSSPGARRFDQFAPSSRERKDTIYMNKKSSKGQNKLQPTNSHKESDVNYVDYFYY